MSREKAYVEKVLALMLMCSSPLWEHGAALVGFPNFLKEHEILQTNSKEKEWILLISQTNQMCAKLQE